MTGRLGELRGPELWLRCPFCGDSQNDPEKAHFSVNVSKFIYYCYRCNTSGRLTAKQAFQLMAQFSGDMSLDFTDDSSDEDWPSLIPGAGSRRKSALDRYHYIDKAGVTWDAFYMRHPKDNTQCGVHIRTLHHKISLGDKGLSWAGPGPLISTPDNPIRIVEGPYDVLGSQEACTFGLITVKSLQDLAGHYLLLTPDGDVWLDPRLLKTTITILAKLLEDRTKYVVGLEYLEDGADPDDVPVAKRQYIPRESLTEFLRERIHYLANNTERIRE